MTDVITTVAYGSLRGRSSGCVAIYKGVPYGENVAGQRRWRRSSPVSPWRGVRDALDFGPRAIQPESSDMRVTSQEMEDLMAQGGPSDGAWRQQNEECLTLNIWAPSSASADKRPVLFWCHGGKYFGETPPAWWFDGESLARREDVVVVTVRHRVGVLGFLHLADLPGGESYGDSANVGMLDLVDALTWVKENIASFGGDPGNVTIFGELGGGLKVSVLLGMPAARGLFHKAIIQSGAQLEAYSREHGTAAALALMDALGIPADQPGALLEVAPHRLVEAQISLAPSLVARATLPRFEFEPVMDGHVLPDGCFDPARAPSGGAIPLLLGTCATEGTFFLSAMPNFGAVGEGQARGMLGGMLGARAEEVIALYASNRPGSTPTELLTAIFGDFVFRRKAILLAETRADHAAAPTYMYLLGFETDVAGGKYHTPHILDLPLVFAHPEHPILGTDPSRFAVSRQMTAAWAAFARSGDPGHNLLPDWPAYNRDTRATMVFDQPPRLEYNPRGDERQIW